MALKKVAKKEKINPKEALRKSMSQRMDEELKELKVYQFSPQEELHIDEEHLSLPYEITEVPSKDLGEYLNAYTQQKMYMRTLIGWAECLVEEARRDYVEASKHLYKELNKTKLSETAKEREVNSDDEVLLYFEIYMDCKKKLQLLNLNVASIEDAIFLISREVSRRVGDFNNESRNYNVNR